MARKTKTILLVICCLLVLCLIVVLTCSQLVVSNAKGKAFSEIDSIIAVDTIELEHISKQDSFTVVYRQPINGYEIKAVVKLGEFSFLHADLTFTKGVDSFTLHTSSFGDTIYSKGYWGEFEENEKLIAKYRGRTIEADYHENRNEGETMPGCTPFFFMDLDFDGKEELVVVHYACATRQHSGFDVYRIVEGKPFQIDYPPYKSGDNDDFGMTDYPEFNYRNKTITCPYPEGELSYNGCLVYGISKTKKDIVNANGRKYYFNHLELVKEIQYEKEIDNVLIPTQN